jgi:Protein of unknown function (DUF2452)
MKIKITDQDPDRHNHIEYPMEIGGQKFEVINITEEKDKMLSIATLQAQQEYDRIMELVSVLKKQADDLKRRMDITRLVHVAKFAFKPVAGKKYWLVRDKEEIILSPLGPNDWSCGSPDTYEYIAQVLCLGDFTWQEVYAPIV